MRLFKFLFAIFFVCTTHGQVTVNLSNLKVNGNLITNNTIDFNGNSNINVSLDVNLLTFNGNSSNIFGNLFLFFKPASSESEVQVGFTSVTFIVSNPPFVSQTTFTSENSFNAIGLSRSNFFATGGTFYARYINNANLSYTSSNISVVGGTRTSINQTPINQTNTICCDQTIRYGDKTSLITGSSLNVSGLDVRWVKSPNIISNNYTSSNYNDNFISDYLLETTSFRRRLTNTSNYTNMSNSITITVVPTPIISNIISANASIMDDGSYEVGVNDPIELVGENARVNLNVLSNPFHAIVRSDPHVNVDNYQWQYKTEWSNDIWIDVPNATLPILSGFNSMIPGIYSRRFFYIRRIAKYQNISNVSNVIKIVIRKSSTSNTICCDQLLARNPAGFGFQVPSSIIGSVPVFSVFEALGTNNPTYLPFNVSNPLYQWQIRSRSGSWSNIIGANSKDYSPPVINTFNTSNMYRRIVRFNYRKLSHYFGSSPVYYDEFYETYSSLVTIRTGSGGTRSARFSDSEEVVNDSLNYVIYPNPTSYILNVSAKDLVSSENLSIYNQLGQKIELKYLKFDGNNVSIDVSNLQKGIYYLHFGDTSNVVKKFIID